jgi:hypothetical protein
MTNVSIIGIIATLDENEADASDESHRRLMPQLQKLLL